MPHVSRAIQNIALLTYFFCHSRSLTELPIAVRGQSKKPLLCNVFAVPGAVSMSYVVRLHDARQKQLCNSMEA
jgi:hypothetical protein